MLLRKLLSASATGCQPEAAWALIRDRGDRHVDRGLLGKKQRQEFNRGPWHPAAVAIPGALQSPPRADPRPAAASMMMTPGRRLSSSWVMPRWSPGLLREPLYIFS